MIYAELEKACLPLIEHYHDDLVKHDRQAIEHSPTTPFLHWTREMGTWITFMRSVEDLPPEGKQVPYLFGWADRYHIVNEVVSMAEGRNTEANRPSSLAVHHFDGKKLRRIDCDKAVDIARDYRRRMEREFRKDRVAI